MRRRLRALLVFLALPFAAHAAEPAVGSAAPAFSLRGSDGRMHTLAEHLGKRGVVVAWFPKAFTAG